MTSNSNTAANATTTVAAQAYPNLQQTIEEIVDTGFVGLQLRVDDERGEWVGSAGRSVLGEPATPPINGRVRIGSNTKTFVATVVLQLVAENKIALDTPAVDYLPRVTLDPRITVRMLLQHTSGIFNFTGEVYEDGTTAPGVVAWGGKEWVDNRFQTHEADELVRLALAQPARFEPGTDWSYANTNYVLAKLLIEAVTGHPLAEEMQRLILGPLGLSDTVVPETSTEIGGPHAHAYYRYDDAGATAGRRGVRRRGLDLALASRSTFSVGLPRAGRTEQMNNGVTIGQAAVFAGVTIKTVRHYEKNGLLEEPARDSSGYRRYGSAALLRLVQVRTLAGAGVPLAEIGALLDADAASFATELADVERRLTERIVELIVRRDTLHRLADGDRTLLPDRAVALLARLPELGISQADIAAAREGWVLARALVPEGFDDYLANIENAIEDPEFLAVYRRASEAMGWEPDDPRIEDLATAVAEHYLANPDHLEIVTGLQAGTEAATRYTLIRHHGEEPESTAARMSTLVETKLRAAGVRIPGQNSR